VVCWIDGLLGYCIDGATDSPHFINLLIHHPDTTSRVTVLRSVDADSSFIEEFFWLF
jgi:hypothetical protein